MNDPIGQLPASRPLRVKLIGNWGPSAQLCAEWERMSQGGGRWNSIEITSDDDVDFWVIVNTPWPGEEYRPERTIVFQMEPWCHGEHQTWGVKTWGEWARPDPAKFLQVRTHRHFPNNAFWQLAATYDELRTRPVRKTAVLSAIISGKYFDPGHIQRVDFLRYIEERDDDVVRVEMYAHDNPLEFSSWVGPHRPGFKDDALLPYRYFLAVENNFEHNFVTEKLWEPILTETLCFYAGAPNAAELIDARAFVPLDLTDFEAAFATIRTALLADEWSRRVEYIRREKRKVLEHFQFFPTVERILRSEMGFTEPPSDVDVTYHAHFADAFDTELPTVAFVHSYTRNGDTRILSEMLSSIAQAGLLYTFDRLYIVNVGDEISLRWTTETAGKVRLIQRTPNAGPGEQLTLELLHAFAGNHPESSILYLHTKGASFDGEQPTVDDWRRLFTHVLVERAGDCLAALADHDVVGANLLGEPRPHFSGNMWWANAAHLARLDVPPDADRHEAEWWVLGAPGVRPLSLHDSGVDHYRERYPREHYAR